MLKPFRFLLAISRAFMLLLLMGIFIFSYLILGKFFFTHTEDKAFKLRRSYLKIINFILGIKCEVTGTPVEGTALYVSNHRSLSDPLILCQYLDAFVIAKAEVESYPLVSKGAELTGILYVKREDRDSRYAVREMMISTLKRGFNVLVYPEGTVNFKKRTLPYRPGTFKEIAKMDIPVVPIVLEYKKEKDVWNNRSTFQHFVLQFGSWRTSAKMVFGKSTFDNDGEKLRQEVETWTNETIELIHKDWDSLFD